MKRFLSLLLVLVGVIGASAQDVIVKKDGTTVLCKIVQVSPTEVVYLKWSDLNGPQYIIDGTLVSSVNYQDGRQDKLNEPLTNSYAPGIQQNGNWEYNDNALLVMDKARNDGMDPKKLKIIGWSVGSGLVLVGAVLIGHSISLDREGYIGGDDSQAVMERTVGICLATAGAATTTGFLIWANRVKKKHTGIACAPIIQHEFKLAEGTMLNASIDLIRDNQTKHSILGLGLKFNF